MKGDANLSTLKAVYFPASIPSEFTGAHPPTKNDSGYCDNLTYFQNYRNENLAKFQMPPYEWGILSTPYSPRPDITAATPKKDLDRMLHTPRGNISMVDPGRQQEVDDFYKACQLHRDQYKDQSGKLHPLDYFKRGEYTYQCPPDTTSTYLKFPQYYTKYRDPITLPLTLGRTKRMPPLPDRVLTGRYSPESCIAYKR